MPKAVPDHLRTVTPYLIVKDAAKAIEFYGKAFGATERARMFGPDGKSIMHAEINIGDSVVYLAGDFPGMEVAWPSEKQWPAVVIHLQVENADAAFKRAVDAGCRVVMPLADMFWGDRYGRLADDYGQHWAIAQHLEDLSPEEMTRRMNEMFAKSGPEC
jgi:uncharacterized glyoxalase superfamily protein PhnB